MSENSCRELHIFLDAMTEAIGFCSYLRLGNGEVIASFVAGKARLAPLQTTSIPCLELCAVVLGCRIGGCYH